MVPKRVLEVETEELVLARMALDVVLVDAEEESTRGGLENTRR